MRRLLCFVGLVVCVGLLPGCVDRRYVVTTDPPGAIVFRNGQYIGATPVDDHFVYYGTYHFTIIADGHETLQVDQEMPAPWYEYPLIDLFSENLFPWPIKDVRRFNYRLEPRRVVNTNELLQEAQNLRNRGQSLGPGSAIPQPGPPAPPPSDHQPGPPASPP
jgi:hypothetical protein